MVGLPGHPPAAGGHQQHPYAARLEQQVAAGIVDEPGRRATGGPDPLADHRAAVPEQDRPAGADAVRVRRRRAGLVDVVEVAGSPGRARSAPSGGRASPTGTRSRCCRSPRRGSSPEAPWPTAGPARPTGSRRPAPGPPPGAARRPAAPGRRTGCTAPAGHRPGGRRTPSCPGRRLAARSGAGRRARCRLRRRTPAPSGRTRRAAPGRCRARCAPARPGAGAGWRTPR